MHGVGCEMLGSTYKGNSSKKVEKLFTVKDQRPIILFDGVCELCSSFVNFLLENDPEGKFRFAALQSEAGKSLLIASGREPDDYNSIVVVQDPTRHKAKSEAVLYIGEQISWKSHALSAAVMPVICKSLRFLFPQSLRDFVMDIISKYRFTFFDELDICRVSDSEFTDRFVQFGSITELFDSWSPFTSQEYRTTILPLESIPFNTVEDTVQERNDHSFNLDTWSPFTSSSSDMLKIKSSSTICCRCLECLEHGHHCSHCHCQGPKLGCARASYCQRAVSKIITTK